VRTSQVTLFGKKYHWRPILGRLNLERCFDLKLSTYGVSLIPNRLGRCPACGGDL
jgi:hypothetical protein